ncbi:beta-galactosidase [Sinomicrobium kalidii]|uniref:glycoside hydrolase family 2 protein n=1 Tax=Sinomicrobium kalidii TaxID=2900738 RepID=UPI001E644660|nr:sugar-binding domain-containing protein [Sinomicrobium kalidii]UGU15875.1 beta-galactosidase [Sinomicrobium kalidii]
MKKIVLALLFLPFLCMAQKEEDVLKFSLQTPWTGDVNPENVWDEYPRPQMKRDNWKNLNGLWKYAILPVSEEFPTRFQGEILVPFAVESELSRVKKLVGKDNNLWYQTNFTVPEHSKNEKIHLNFGAVDWEATVFINGKKAGEHRGGFTPFSLDITRYLKEGRQTLTVKVWDPTDAGTQPRGKQVADPKGIWYTPVTGIWQTVWLEKTAADHIRTVKNTPFIDDALLKSELTFSDLSHEVILKIKALSDGKEIASASRELKRGQQQAAFQLKIPDQILWSPENPHLYNLEIQLLKNGEIIDEVSSYFGMRKISLGKDKNGYTRILLNNKPLFQFGLLDQGWWPDGLYTAPSVEAMMYDVEMTEKWGFNMLRKHVKVEPAVYYYECDKMGMLIWQDMPNGNYFKDLRIQAWEEKDAQRTGGSARQFEKELKEMMDYFHTFPSIVVWVPFNEGWGQYDTERVTKWVENYDPSRLTDSPSGWTDRGVGDIIDVHLYPGPGMEFPEEKRAAVIGEFGGIGWAVNDHIWWNKKNWGYLTLKGQKEYKERFTALMRDLTGLKSFGLSAAIYTQTTDVEGEVNGLMTYDRKVLKLPPEETRPLIAPLYKKPGRFRTIIPDSEHTPNAWKAAYDVNPDWTGDLKQTKGWQEQKAPFSSYNNYFLPDGTAWKTRKDLCLFKTFDLDRVPEEIILRYYLDKASMKVYLNGQPVTSEKHEGGRKRHYRNQLIANARKYLKRGKNTMAIRVQPQNENHAFDLGLYRAEIKDEKEF